MKRLLAMALALVMALALSCGTLAFAAPGDIETGVGGNEGDFTDPVPQPDPDPDIPPVGPTYCTVTFESDEEKGELEGQTQITVTPGSKIPENRVPEVIEAVEGTFLGWVIEGREDEGLVDFDTLRVNTSITLIAVYEDAPQEDEGLLNKADHIAYMQGDGDSTFRPNDSLTRAEAATVFYNLLLDQDVEITVSFTDVSEDAWYVEQVGVLASLGIIQGDGDGTFRPGDTISRAEFATMAAKFENLEEGSVSFSDVPESHWAYPYIASAAAKGWVGGYPDGTFRPDEAIDRAAVARIVNGVLDRQADEEFVDSHEVISFTDLSEEHWAYYEIMEAVNAHEYVVEDGAEIWQSLK